MIELIDISKADLVSINLTELGNCIPEQQFKNYFIDHPGREHYTLLAYISSLYNDATLLDIGTYKGCSSLALSYNSMNSVISFDLNGKSRNLSSYPSNVSYVVDNVINGSYDDLIDSAEFILLDTNHDGTFEYQFYDYLLKKNWTGILMLDDIHLNSEMKMFWNDIKLEKQDITNIGHWSGTGIVRFT